MKKVTRILILLLVVMATGSCELAVDVDVPFEGKKLTINSFFLSDSVFSATVLRNKSVLDDAPHERVNDATVVLSDESGPIDTLKHSLNGNYRSTLKPVLGKRYTIAAHHPYHETATGSSSIPPASEILNASYQEVIRDGRRINFTVTFKNDPTQTRYYEVLAMGNWDEVDPQTKTIKRYYTPLPLASDDPVLENASFGSGTRFLISNVYYSEPEITLSFYTNGYLDAAGASAIVRSVTEDYYRYTTTAQLQFENAGNPFAQPVSVYTNIKNGFGIFAGIHTTVRDMTTAGFEIIDVQPRQVRIGDPVTITLAGVKVLGPDQMTINSLFEAGEFAAYGVLLQHTDNSITVQVPTGAVSGKVWVKIDGRFAGWQQGITILP
jgi:hypothetical protein